MTELPEIENNETDERSHLWLSIGHLPSMVSCMQFRAIIICTSFDNGFDVSRFVLLSAKGDAGRFWETKLGLFVICVTLHAPTGVQSDIRAASK